MPVVSVLAKLFYHLPFTQDSGWHHSVSAPLLRMNLFCRRIRGGVTTDAADKMREKPQPSFCICNQILIHSPSTNTRVGTYDLDVAASLKIYPI
jgi:hypothetical protein